MTRPDATLRAMRQLPSASPGSTSWPATRASRPTASACSPSNPAAGTVASTAWASATSALTSCWRASASSHAQAGLPRSWSSSWAPRPTMAAAGTSRRTGRMAPTSCLTVSRVATASSSSIESNARRCRPAKIPVWSITIRTASKVRSGRPEARSLPRHKVSTVGRKPWSVRASPPATFPAIVQASCRLASRSPNPPTPATPWRWPPDRPGPMAGLDPKGTSPPTARQETGPGGDRPGRHTPNPHPPGGGTGRRVQQLDASGVTCPLHAGSLPRTPPTLWDAREAICAAAS